MTRTLNEQFAVSGGAPITLNGVLVHGIYVREVRNQEIIKVEIVRTSGMHVHGLNFKVVDGYCQIDTTKAPAMIFWVDTCPSKFDIQIYPKKGKSVAVLKIWNSWKGSNSVEHAWIGNAGMLIDEKPFEAEIKFSAGIGAVNFDDFVVRLKFNNGAEQA
jgi:hypothetical protein